MDPVRFQKSPFSKGGQRGIKIEEMLPANKELKNHSRTLRKNMTDAEILLWSRIRRKQIGGYQFYRQKVIGNYIVDFYCHKAKLVIEVDGSQHYGSEGKEQDRVRDNYMTCLELRVLRFSDREVFENLDGIIETIWIWLRSKESP